MASHNEVDNQLKQSPWLVLATIAFGMSISVLDQSAITLALPNIAAEFDANIPEVQWISIGYGLVTASLILPMGSLSDIAGRKPIYISGFLMFTIAAMFVGTSTSLMTAIIFRCIQGIGGAMIQANALAILITIFPVTKRGLVIGLFMTTVGLASVAGPIVGGLIIDQFTWKWIILGSVPLGITSIIFGLLLIPNLSDAQSLQKKRSKFDWIGSGLFAASLSLFLFSVGNGQELGWFTPLIMFGILTSSLLALCFIIWQSKHPNPLVPIFLLKRKNFTLGSAACFFAFLSGSSVFFTIPFFAQGVLGYGARASGLMMVPMAGLFAISGPIAGNLSDKLSERTIEFIGLCLIGGSLFSLSFTQADIDPSLLMLQVALLGAGLGFFYAPNSSSVLSSVEKERYGVGTAFLNLIRNSSSIIGVALCTAIISYAMGTMGLEANLNSIIDSGENMVQSNNDIALAFTRGFTLSLRILTVLVIAAIIFTFIKGKNQDRFSLEP